MRALIAADRDAFYAPEIEARERFGHPPFGRLASLVISAPDRAAAEVTRGVSPRWCRGTTTCACLAGGSAAGAGARSPSLPPAGEIAARLRSLGLAARLAQRGAEAAGEHPAGCRCRPQSLL